MARKRKKKQPSERLVDLLQELEQEFRYDILLNESDRGAVLVATAFVDEALEHLLRSFMTAKCPSDDEKTLSSAITELLEPSSPFSPLGNFSSRITICYVFGLVSSDTMNALHCLRGLRNKFAHRSEIKPHLDYGACKSLINCVFDPGVIDVRFVGAVPGDAAFETQRWERFAFSAIVWVLLCAIRKQEKWWRTEGKPDSPVLPIGKYEGPTCRLE